MDDTDMPSEETLSAILAFMQAAHSVTSYPASDPNQWCLHRALLVLESRGQVRRHSADAASGSVTWIPAKRARDE